MRFAILLAVCLMSPFTWLNSQAGADYYTYTDQNGIFCMTNNLASVPPKARATMKVVREEKQGKNESNNTRQLQSAPRPGGIQQAPAIVEETLDRQASAPIEAKPTSTFQRLCARLPWFRPLLIVCGICGLFVLITKIATLLPSPQLARVLYLAFFLGIFVCGYKLYADHVVKSYFLVKTRILRLFTAANARQAPETGEPSETAPFVVKGQEMKETTREGL